MKLQVELNALYLMRCHLFDYMSMMCKQDPIKYQTQIGEIADVLDKTIYNKLTAVDSEDISKIPR